MKPQAVRPIVLLVALAFSLVACGCSSLADIAGTASAVTAGAATGNPAVAIGVGGVVRGSIDATEKAYARVNARHTHELITAVAAPLSPGESGNWHEAFRFSDDVSGRVEVTRLIESKLAVCKELAFTIDGDPQEVVPYRGAICRTTGDWRWAMAEPSTERWSVLRN